jgi:hypothetical protein
MSQMFRFHTKNPEELRLSAEDNRCWHVHEEMGELAENTIKQPFQNCEMQWANLKQREKMGSLSKEKENLNKEIED